MAERWAVCIPVPPAATGVATYAEVHLPALAEVLPVEVFAPEPRGEQVAGLPVRPLEEIERADVSGVVYHVGNAARFHAAIYRAARRRPGVVVLHELMLQHLVRDVTVHAGRPAGWVEAMAAAYGVAGRRTATRWLAGEEAGDLWERPLFEPLLDASRGAIVHTPWAERRVLAARPEAAVRYVPPPLFAEPAPAAAQVAAARERAGAVAGAPLVGSFGFLSRAKRVDVVLAAFAAVRRRRPDARLVLVGDPAPDPGLAELLAGPAGAGVTALGFVDHDTFRAVLAAVDVAVNLRHPSGGELSGVLLRLLEHGVPTVVTDRGPTADLPAGCVATVAPGASEVEDLAATLLALLGSPALARRIGAAGRAWALREHDPQASARGYAAAIRELSARPEPTPPPPPPVGIRSEIVGAIGAAMAEVGVRSGDGEAVAAVADAAAVIDPTARR